MQQRPWLTSYPEGVPTTLEPYPEKSLYSILADSAARFPNRPAISFRPPGSPMGKTLTYRELERLVDQFSRVLASLGVQKGDRVGLILPNIPQYVIGYYAALRLGAVVVGNNPLYTERELSHQLKDAGIEVVVVLENLYPKLGAIRDEVGLREVIVTRIPDFLPFPISLLAPRKMKKDALKKGEPWPPVPADAKVRWWKDLMAGSYPAVDPVEVNAKEDLAGLIYTGGTTGLSKGAMLTHHNLVSNVIQGRSWFPALKDGEEAVMCVLPFFHSFGMTVAMNVGIHMGAKLILELQFDLKATLASVQREKPTLFPGVPRIYIAINEAKETPNFDLKSIRACFSGAAPLPLVVQEKFEKLTGGKIVEGYGLTETSPIATSQPIEGKRKVRLDRRARSRHGLSPRRSRRLDEGDAAGRGGRADHRRAPGHAGLLQPARRDRQVIKTDADGRRWLLTGDIAKMDEEGYFFIVDRKKDMIIVSGFNVYPTDIEQVLYRHPKVQKAAVVGIPDDTTGEAVKAYIVPKEGESPTKEEIIEFTKDPKRGSPATGRRSTSSSVTPSRRPWWARSFAGCSSTRRRRRPRPRRAESP